MQRVIDLLKAHGELKIINKPTDVNLEIAHIAYVEVKKPHSKALLFTKPIDKERGIAFDVPILVNLFGSFRRVELLIGKPDKIAKAISSLLQARPKSLQAMLALLPKLWHLKNLLPKRAVHKRCQELIMRDDEVDLMALPILKTWPQDGGLFITMGLCFAQSLDGSVKNLGMYRLQVHDSKHLGLHWQIHKDCMGLFEEYKKAKQKMPISIAIGGDPLYTWCATAPLPYGIFELLLYGIIANKRPKMVRCISNPLSVPYDCDFVIEGYVNPDELKDEGRFGDHTGFYTPIEPYPVLEVHTITSKKNPVYLATVVGKPPLEDKYLGHITERVFLPLLQMTIPHLVDYYMPENGVFHNLILVQIHPKFPGHAKQIMHSLWGIGQMSFVKHAIFVGPDAPALNSAAIIPYILERFCVQNCLISEGICDALDHASNQYAQGGKLGIDCTKEEVISHKIKQSDEEILEHLKPFLPNIQTCKQIFTHTANPITLVAINKTNSLAFLDSLDLESLKPYLSIVVILDASKNDLNNQYMLLWRVVNNIDAKRDCFIKDDMIWIDATDKNAQDGYQREWPKETDCSKEVLEDLYQRGYFGSWPDSERLAFYRQFHIDKSYSTKEEK